ncbi:hypothetical protein [Croceitalea vernalis]|uniref:Uncharacterized protein n=1 Tax=Croceitalea vernalis TaxID=3075599 RepID=A0ABU3BIN2_9FLAO|nr:hypothetical protein [Croceitalea sp. P007]MDT0622024.1 hypothetical protein [Croceitalea sp. P007]
MNRLIFLFLLTYQFGLSQNTNKEVYLVHNLYATGFDNDEYLYSTDSIKFENNRKISDLLNAISNVHSINDIFRDSKIDTLKILNNPLDLINKYKRSKVDWNQEQKDFIKPKLQDLKNYKKYYSDYLNNGCCITMHQRYRDEYQIRIFENNLLVNEITSRKSIGGFKIPWTNSLTGVKNYNFEIEEIILDSRKKPKPLKGNRLQKYLTNKIIDYNITKLYELSAYTYNKEIKELEAEFDIKYFGEVYGRGRYIWDEPQTFKIKLHNNEMLANINLVFMASKQGKSIYSRDSIISNYKNPLKRVQNISFITGYLNENPESTLDIYFFNNKTINEYNIDGVNKSPEDWEKQDNYVKSLEWYKTADIKPSFDIEKAIKTSEKNNCGCNYRFDREFIEQAIFFEIRNKNNDSSVWFLLPDDTVLLYLMQGQKVLEYDYKAFGNEYAGVQWPCKRFELNGKLIKR